ncbi:hypothetical protein Anapl_02344 [Anas platyrhynchos]|uniref:Uncharacterized protein n=1 Tax=Anas platyrhynchos TaxID=8839 RepID=R0LLB0_ANAPL|nr:hypothetical protein Anapl_02344 [Anas platyrhynchos]
MLVKDTRSTLIAVLSDSGLLPHQHGDPPSSSTGQLRFCTSANLGLAYSCTEESDAAPPTQILARVHSHHCWGRGATSIELVRFQIKTGGHQVQPLLQKGHFEPVPSCSVHWGPWSSVLKGKPADHSKWEVALGFGFENHTSAILFFMVAKKMICSLFFLWTKCNPSTLKYCPYRVFTIVEALTSDAKETRSSKNRSAKTLAKPASWFQQENAPSCHSEDLTPNLANLCSKCLTELF